MFLAQAENSVAASPPSFHQVLCSATSQGHVMLRSLFLSFDYAEKKVQSRWKNLRDTFQRRLRDLRSSDNPGASPEDSMTCIRWTYFTKMLFLKDAVEGRMWVVAHALLFDCLGMFSTKSLWQVKVVVNFGYHCSMLPSIAEEGNNWFAASLGVPNGCKPHKTLLESSVCLPWDINLAPTLPLLQWQPSSINNQKLLQLS